MTPNDNSKNVQVFISYDIIWSYVAGTHEKQRCSMVNCHNLLLYSHWTRHPAFPNRLHRSLATHITPTRNCHHRTRLLTLRRRIFTGRRYTVILSNHTKATSVTITAYQYSTSFHSRHRNHLQVSRYKKWSTIRMPRVFCSYQQPINIYSRVNVKAQYPSRRRMAIQYMVP